MAYFSRDTDPLLFRCACGRPSCGAPEPKPELLRMLESLRSSYGLPIVVLSGPRCDLRNAREGGARNSDHLTGEAADIACRSSRERYELLAAALEVGVPRIGIGKNFIHVGVCPKKDQQVVWTYYTADPGM